MNRKPSRRTFLKTAAVAAASAAPAPARARSRRKPNLVFVFADQWRAQAAGYAGDPNVRTPTLDRLAAESVDFRYAVSGCPVCSPYRASLMTGQYPHTHGVFLNDVPLRDGAVSIAEALVEAGYSTGYIGKWHLDGHGRSAYIPPERRQGFQFWKVLECTHDYNHSFYYGDENAKLLWDGYDAVAQTRDACGFIRDHARRQPFALFLSWGPPHNPYKTAPETYRRLYRAEDLVLRANVPESSAASARQDLAGYYAHISALDDCVGDLLNALDNSGIEDDTVFVFTSDHGDMLGSQGEMRKQRPWDESIRVPFLLRYPGALGRRGRVEDCLLNTPDIMPTLLGLAGIAPPRGVQGTDFSGVLSGTSRTRADTALLACYHPFGEWTRQRGGKEYRGVRTGRHTYVRDLQGPWLLYDNDADPYQLDNQCNKPEYARRQARLDGLLDRKLREVGDTFLPGAAYIRQWGYTTDTNGTVPYEP